MKKVVLYSLLLVLVVCLLFTPEVRSEKNIQMIPDDAIRLRILANSDSVADQEIKIIVRDEVNAYITELVQHIDRIEVARAVVAANIPEIEVIIEATLKRENIIDDFKVEYNSNVDFPTKIYGNLEYPAGEYEAVLITIGEGLGENWWCVLFPPLCFLDFSTEAIDTEPVEEMEVKFFFLKWFAR